MHIRILESEDYDEYLKLINEFRPTTFTKQEFTNFVYKLPALHNIWVMEIDEQLVGTATVLYEHKLIHNMCVYAHIEDVCISESVRGKGYGSLLLKHIFNESKHCFKVTLVCDEKVKDFYLKNGLEQRGIQCCQLLKNL